MFLKRKRFNCIIAVFMFFLSLKLFVTHLKNKHPFYENNSSPKNVVVLLTTSVKPRYRFLLPITIKFWQLLDVQAVVVLINDGNADGVDLSETMKILKEFNVTTKLFKSNRLSSSSLSQIIRLFGPVIPSLNKMFTDETILITSDADLAVFNLSNHIPDTSKGKVLHLYDANCCEPIRVPPMRGNYKVKQHIMITIGATVKTWKEIMGFKKNALTIEEIEEYIINEFGETFFHPSDQNLSNFIGSDIWYADQSLISYKINEWLKITSKDKLSAQTRVPRRIDRSNWPTSEVFLNLDIKKYDDCHQPTAAYVPGEWEKYKPFLEFALKRYPELIERFEQYRNSFI